MIFFRLLNVNAINFTQIKAESVEPLAYEPRVLQAEMGT